jgi:uncharacterized protein YjiS (DUF1127 family)
MARPGGAEKPLIAVSECQEAVMLFMTIAAKPLTSVSAGVTRAAAVGATGIRQIVRALVHRREVMRLAELDERGLKDIGLVRSDVAGALAASWLDDPSAVLAQRAGSAAGLAAQRREHALRHAGAGPLPGAGTDLTVARCA